MKYIILLLTVLFSLQSYAADDGDRWLQRNVSIGDGQNEYRRINVTSRTSYDAPITKDGITKMERLFKNVVVEDVPSKVKVGKPLLERAKAFKGGLAGVLGGAAITALIESVGWVMEDGTYVKYKTKEEDIPDDINSFKYYPLNQSSGDLQPLSVRLNEIKSQFPIGDAYSFRSDFHSFNYQTTTYTIYSDSISLNLKVNSQFCTTGCSPSPNYTYGDPYRSSLYNYQLYGKYDNQTEPQKIIITDEDVGGIATGDYKDPVDPKFDITDKKYRPVIVDAYQHDPNNIGNDIANEIDDRIKNAPPTSDGKPAPLGDSRYSTAPQPDKTTNDRSWSDESDTTGEGTTTPVTDPETGQPTGQQSISFKFPVFCEWAFKVCDWYDDWKASDTVYKDHMTKTEEHQTQEKGFWQKVSDWFDWTKEPLDKEPDLQEEEPDTQGIFERTFNTTFSLSNECPPDIPFTLETYFLSGSWNISTRWLCIIFTFLGYPLVFLSHCCGLWILYETVVHRQIKW
ncbi:MAG: hypothetical protein E7D55_15840 [Acinetobacter junii]|nr:hypothetical protein [Acinetobacter junii]